MAQASVQQKASPQPSQSDEELFRDLVGRFAVLAESCARFSQEVYHRAGTTPLADVDGTTRRNLKIARTVFGRWSLEILAVAYLNKSIALSDLRDALGPVTFALLRTKLKNLEKAGLVQREVGPDGKPGDRYTLTHKGTMIAKLGEPVFLYLRLADGWMKPVVLEEPPPPEETEDPTPPENDL